MPFKSPLSKSKSIINKHGLHLRWPRAWIIVLGILLFFLALCIAGMEIGHTIYNYQRSTAFGGFILFFPFIICAIIVMITACLPRLLIIRIAVILCCLMILLCMLLIAYDILVLIDPTRCFFFDCTYAPVYLSNTTYNGVVTGWPLYITWPTYFQITMNAKRIFQSIQLLCAGLFILFASFYILTYFIYRHIRLNQQTTYAAATDRGTFTTYETNRSSPMKSANHLTQSYPPLSQRSQKVTTYTVEGQPDTATQYHHSPTAPMPTTTIITPRKPKTKTFVLSRAPEISYDRLCTRCSTEPRMILTTNYERDNYFPHLCLNCNNELAKRNPTFGQAKGQRAWKP